MKNIQRRREDFANLLNDQNRESVIEKMYETGEIYDRADALSIDEEYENFKIMVKNQVRKRSIKNVGRWLHMMLDYEDERMVVLIKKYLKEVVDNDGGKD